MSAQVFSFLRRPVAPRDWSAQELAEFYRVEAALIQAGLRAVSARGLTDEGEPWFVFCREEDDEVIIHFARIDGRYLISAPAYCGTAMGRDFRALVRSTLESHPVLQPRPKNDNLFLHPAALLVMLVASALLKSGHAAEAAPVRPTAADATNEKHRDVVAAMASAPMMATASMPEAQHESLILAALAAAMAGPVQAESVTIVVSAQLPNFDYHPHPQLTGAPLLEESHNVQAAGAGSVTPAVPLPQSVVGPTVDATPTTLALTVPQSDAGSMLTVLPSAGGPTMQAVSLTVALPVSVPLNASVAVPDPAAGAHLVPLTALSGIAKADLDLLHALSVPDNVAYTPALPVAFSTAIQTGVHATATHVATEHASSPASDAIAAPPSSSAPVAVTAAPEAAQGPAVAPSPAAATTAAGAPATPAPSTATAAPDMSAVLATVEQFQAVSTHPVVVFTDHAAIFYDAAAVTTNLSAVKSFTYDFGDGFSISLVGLPAELVHAGIHM